MRPYVFLPRGTGREPGAVVDDGGRELRGSALVTRRGAPRTQWVRRHVQRVRGGRRHGAAWVGGTAARARRGSPLFGSCDPASANSVRPRRGGAPSAPRMDVLARSDDVRQLDYPQGASFPVDPQLCAPASRRVCPVVSSLERNRIASKSQCGKSRARRAGNRWVNGIPTRYYAGTCGKG